MKSAEDGDLARKLEALQSRPHPTVETSEVAAVVEAIVESLSGDMSVADLKLYRELEHLAGYIHRAKREIAELQPHEIRERHIPMATDELDAVVGATAEATGVILDSAESLERVAGTVPAKVGEEIRNIATRIYEACNFQDVTGQRITKVVRALKHIEEKIDALLHAFGDGVKAPASAAAPSLAVPGGDGHLLHGPQMPQEANKQDDIDAIMASLK